jgi:FKBP-type peptidyl-prolyl cis-trans isomerase 2
MVHRLFSSSRVVSLGDVVEFEFKSCLKDGTVIHSDLSKVRVGSDAITEQMSKAMLGKEIGAEFEIQTLPEERGSAYSEDLVINVNMPKGFSKDNQISAGDFVEIPDPNDSKEIFLARVVEIHAHDEEEEVLKLDLNDPYSDEVIVVKVKVLENLGKDEKFSEVEYERERIRTRQEKIEEMGKKDN